MSFLDLRKNKKWALQAPYSDRSLIRDVLIYDLAQEYFDYAPQARLCELILNGQYYGVYFLSELVKGMKLKKPGDAGDELTGGYIIEMETPPQSDIGYLSQNWNIKYHYKKPDDDITEIQKTYINSVIFNMEKVFLQNDFEEICKIIDIESFIDYQLFSEFTHNNDAYSRSVYFYKERDSKGGLIKMTLWDFNLSLGNSNYRDAWKTDTWRIYDDPTRVLLNGERDSLHYFWGRLTVHKEYRNKLVERWNEYRSGSFSDENIISKIDSLYTSLTVCGAEERNGIAWNIWDIYAGKGLVRPKYIWPNKYVSSSYDDEISYLKKWIIERLNWIDNNIETIYKGTE